MQTVDLDDASKVARSCRMENEAWYDDITIGNLIDKLIYEIKQYKSAVYSLDGKCPRDTNNDGNCGMRYCPFCGENGVLHYV